MGVRLLGKQIVHSKEKDTDFYLIHIDYPADDPSCGRHTEKKFISKELFDLITKNMFDREIDFEWSFNGRYPSIKSIRVLK